MVHVASVGVLRRPVVLKIDPYSPCHYVQSAFFNLYFAAALRYRFHLGCCTFFGLGLC